MSERVKVKPIAEKIAAIILQNRDDPRLKWTPARDKVTINMIKLLGGDYEQTRAGRRKRFQAVIEPVLTAKGWTRGTIRGVFLRGAAADKAV